MQTIAQTYVAPTTVAPTTFTSTVAITGSDEKAIGIAALMAVSGQAVALHTGNVSLPSICEVFRRGATTPQLHGAINFNSVTSDVSVALRGASTLLITGSAADAVAFLRSAAPHLRTGQTLVFVDPPIGMALEATHLLRKLKVTAPLTIVETGPLVDEIAVAGRSVLLRGTADRVCIAGRTLNETRTALGTVGQVIPQVVPASNIMERAFTHAGKFVRAAHRLLVVLGSGDEPRRIHEILTPASQALLNNLELEIHAIARAYGRHATATECTKENFCESVSELKERLAEEINDNFMVLSGLAQVARLPIPIIDSLIDLTSAVTGSDLRKQGRDLSRLGLVGMDVAEIIEQVNA